ncbi:hypothetical protein HHK36_010766 [Tetracentron sinense]|uniref:GAT domain-containing protein n=1 Tax=Tetracentron sinense TaxID=13715 RepID=A0A835DJA1_TETSI|nr:hypothetical protein HHK36_010766 [Tetracentron sinense]
MVASPKLCSGEAVGEDLSKGASVDEHQVPVEIDRIPKIVILPSEVDQEPLDHPDLMAVQLVHYSVSNTLGSVPPAQPAIPLGLNSSSISAASLPTSSPPAETSEVELLAGDVVEVAGIPSSLVGEILGKPTGSIVGLEEREDREEQVGCYGIEQEDDKQAEESIMLPTTSKLTEIHSCALMADLQGDYQRSDIDRFQQEEEDQTSDSATSGQEGPPPFFSQLVQGISFENGTLSPIRGRLWDEKSEDLEGDILGGRHAAGQEMEPVGVTGAPSVHPVCSEEAMAGSGAQTGGFIGVQGNLTQPSSPSASCGQDIDNSLIHFPVQGTYQRSRPTTRTILTIGADGTGSRGSEGRTPDFIHLPPVTELLIPQPVEASASIEVMGNPVSKEAPSENRLSPRSVSRDQITAHRVEVDRAIVGNMVRRTHGSESVPKWVLDHIADFGKFLGLSYEGRDSEVLDLFRSLEPQGGSPRGHSSPRSQDGQNKRLTNELRRLSSSMNFSTSIGQVRGSDMRIRRIIDKRKVKAGILRVELSLLKLDYAGFKQEVIVDLVGQCRTYKQRVVHLVNSSLDESLLCEGLALNDDMQRLLAKHEAIASGTSIRVEKPKPVQALVDIDDLEVTTRDNSAQPDGRYQFNKRSEDVLAGNYLKCFRNSENLATQPYNNQAL